MLSASRVRVTQHEGFFHAVKRMIAHVGGQVAARGRVNGPLSGLQPDINLMLNQPRVGALQVPERWQGSLNGELGRGARLAMVAQQPAVPQPAQQVRPVRLFRELRHALILHTLPPPLLAFRCLLSCCVVFLCTRILRLRSVLGITFSSVSNSRSIGSGT